jgi:hypothetical protein
LTIDVAAISPFFSRRRDAVGPLALILVLSDDSASFGPVRIHLPELDLAILHYGLSGNWYSDPVFRDEPALAVVGTGSRPKDCHDAFLFENG